jgi:Acetyltransferase (GNAT) domain
VRVPFVFTSYLDRMTPDSNRRYTVHAATTANEVEQLRPFWAELSSHPDVDIDFYSFFVGTRLEESRPYILVASKDGETRAILVGRLEKSVISLRVGYCRLLRLGVRQFTFLQDGFLGESGPRVAEAMVGHIHLKLKEGIADRALLCNVDVNTELYRYATATPWAAGSSNDTTHRWRTRLPRTVEEFLKRRSQKHRYWLRRIARVLDAEFPGKIKYVLYREKSDVQRFCVDAEKVARTTYQRGLAVGFVSSEENRRRLELAAEKGWLRAYAIFLGEEPLAFWCGRFYKAAMYLDWTGYKPAYRKYELGTMLFLKMVEDLCNCQAKEIDYGMGAASYKERFGDHNRVEALVSIYAPSLKGFAAKTFKSIDTTTNNCARALLRKIGAVDKIKKIWRTRLASPAENCQGRVRRGMTPTFRPANGRSTSSSQTII